MDDDAGKWMTYAQLATLRGTSTRAAVMLVRRHRWRRQKDNSGHTLAFVPAIWAEPVAGHADSARSGNSSGHGEGHSAHYSAAPPTVPEGALAEANKRADVAMALADRLTAQL